MQSAAMRNNKDDHNKEEYKKDDHNETYFFVISKRHLWVCFALKLSQLKIKLIASFTYLIVVSFDEFFFLKHHLWPFLHYDFFNWNDIVIILNTLCLLQMYTLNLTFRSTIYKIEIENNQHFWQAIVVYFVFKASFMASFLDTISFSFLIV